MSNRRWALAVAMIASAAAGGACDKVLGITQKVSGEAGVPGLNVTLGAASLRIVRGQSASIGVSVQRTGGLSGIVNVYVTGQPSGVTVDTLQIASDESSGTLTISAASSTPLGASGLSVLATSGSTSIKALPLRLVVQETSGTRDATFGTSGRVAVPLGPHGFTGIGPGGLQLGSDGSVFLCGWAGSSAGDSSIAVARLTPAGIPDPSFGGTGIVLVRVADSSADACMAMFLRGGQGINLAGYSTPPATGLRAMLVGRLTPAGFPDRNTNDGGFVATSYAGTDSFADTLLPAVIPGDTEAYVAGGAVGGQPTIARYTHYGSLDLSFGTAGNGTVSLGTGGGAVRWLAQQSAGDLVAAVDSSTFELVRLTAAGEPDPSFGSAGVVTVDVGGQGSSDAEVAIVEPAGSPAQDAIVAVGIAATAPGARDTAVARLTPSGSLDPTFGDSGWKTAHFDDGDSVVSAAALDDQGSILVGGQAPSGVFSVVRFTAAGALDTSFATAGRAALGAGAAQAVAVDSIGRVVVAGTAQSSDGSSGVVVYRLWP